MSSSSSNHSTLAPKRELAWGLFFGVIFGFLLQKGGVAKFEVLIGVLLLRDFTVMQVMLSAILVGMIGVYALHLTGHIKLQLKPTQWGANVIGGLIFGAGFALSAYCPGTCAAALGQGNFDALFVIFGLMAGSLVYAKFSDTLENTVGKWGDKGELTFPELFNISPGKFIPIVSVFILLLLLLLECLS